MGYTVWIKVENNEGNPGDPDEAWWRVLDADTRAIAVAEAEQIAIQLRKMELDVDRLDDDWVDDDPCGQDFMAGSACVLPTGHSGPHASGE